MMRLRNVLSLITVLALKSRDVDSVDPHGVLGVFLYCPCGKDHSILPCDDDDHDSVADDVHACEREEDAWDNHYSNSLN